MRDGRLIIGTEMLMADRVPSKDDALKNEMETNSTVAQWNELLVKSTVPSATVAIKLCNNNNGDARRRSSVDKRGILSTFHRRTFSRISFKSETGPLLSRYRQTRFSSRRVRKRVVFKHGDCNVVQENVAKRRRRYLQDIFTTLVDAQWRWTLLVFSMNFVLSWLGFALIWWLIAYMHGDLEDRDSKNPNVTFTPCVEEIHGFISCFLFSVETQHTIGYGSKHTTDECLEAVFVMCIQSMTGVILQAFMVGIVFAKLSRPKKRTQTLLFSRNAVICQRDGQPCLMFRVGDMRKSHIIEAHVRAQMIKRKVTKEGELLPFFQTELKVGGDGDEDKIFFIWPTTIVHKIDQHSPLYHISASDMLRERFEIVVILEGVIESTGMTTQARSSYLPSEILWGHRFEHIITFQKETGEYEVNYTLFNNTYEVDTPLCSAAELDQLRAMQRAKGERSSTGAFPSYRDASSSSLTTSSGSSLASSTGGLHMQIPSLTPPTPIPVMITGPDGSLRRHSVNEQTASKPPIFYTHDEDEEDYDQVLEDINATLRKNRAQSVNNREEKRACRESPRAGLEPKRLEHKPPTETMKRNTSRPTLDHGQSHTSLAKKSPSRSTLDSRHTRFADSPERSHEPAHPATAQRRSSICDGSKQRGESTKKASFTIDDEIGKSKTAQSQPEAQRDTDIARSNHHTQDPRLPEEV